MRTRSNEAGRWMDGLLGAELELELSPILSREFGRMDEWTDDRVQVGSAKSKSLEYTTMFS